uniref:Uncharacterized protein n=1 Tax=Phytophthora ramorum TaxID=164328 RepID=H3GI74_PHYRM
MPSAPQPEPGDTAQGGEESKLPRGYFPPDENTGSPLFLERLGAIRGLIEGPISRGAYESALIQKVNLFSEDVEAARCVLVAQHWIPLKAFIILRKKGENKGDLHPPKRRTWVALRGYSAQELKEIKEDRLLYRILDQCDLRIQFAHLVSKRKLYFEMEGLKREALSGAHNECGYGNHASTTVPRPSAKRPPTTFETAAASVPRSRQPSGCQTGAARSSPMSSVTRELALPLAAPLTENTLQRGSGFLHYSQGEPEEVSLSYEYETPPQRLDLGGLADARSGKSGSLSLLRGDVTRLSQECEDLHSRVDRRASSYEVDCLRDEVAHLRSEFQNRPRYPDYRETQSCAYSQPNHYGSYPYGGASSRPQAYAYSHSPAPASAWQTPQQEAGAQFEVVNSPPQNPLSLPAGDQKPEGRGRASDDPHKTSGGSSSTSW